MIADFLRMFVEFLRAYFSMILVLVVLGGIALVVSSVNLVSNEDDRLIAQVDVILGGTGMAITFVAGYVIPKWFSGWARPSYPSEPKRDNLAMHSDGGSAAAGDRPDR